MRQYALWLDTTLPGISMSILRCSDDRWEIVGEFHETRVGATAHINKVFYDLIAESQVSIDQINHLIMGSGPGSFTGIKIGMAWALGFAAGFDGTLLSPIPDENCQNTSSNFTSKTGEVGEKGLRLMGVSALEMAALGIEGLKEGAFGESKDGSPEKAAMNILLKVTASHGFLLRLDLGPMNMPDSPREVSIKLDELPSRLGPGVTHLACPWPEVSAILEGRKVKQHESLRVLAQNGLVEFLNQKKMQWQHAFPQPRYLKLSTAEEKLLMKEKGEQLG